MLMFRNTDKVYSTFCISTFYSLSTVNQKITLNYLVLQNMHFLAFFTHFLESASEKTIFIG